MKYYVIAGEASGDLHGSNLIKELVKLDRQAKIRGWGGDLMKSAGAEIVKHYKDLAFMGFIEVIQNISSILKNFKYGKQDILSFQPDILILIDYPGFNLRMAKWAKENNFKIIYYISPQVWAWKEGRVKTIKKVVDKMLVILPFEKNYFEDKWDYKVTYVGHPLVQVIDEFLGSKPNFDSTDKPVIALLPGSRKQEIAIKLPVMLKVSAFFPDYSFIIAKAPSLEDSFYRLFLASYPNVRMVSNETYALLSSSSAALVTSGTATLETALFGVPEVVCYKGSLLSYQIARRLVKIKYISLVNLIMDKEIVKELIQNEMNVKNVKDELQSILYDSAKRQKMKNDYDELKKLLKKEGNASARAAQEIVGFLQATS